MLQQERSVKMEKKVAKQDKRILGFNLQLAAYTRLIRKVGTIPVLDSNMVNFLQALLDQLLKFTEFESFAEETELERGLVDLEVVFALSCTYCNRSGFASGLDLFAHLFNDPHDGIPHRKKKSFQQLRGPMRQDVMGFLEREKHILTRHHFREALLVPLVDFYFLTKTFLKLTSRYLTALGKLDQKPSMVVARGVDELLRHVVSLVDKAHCIESVPHYNTLLFQYSLYSVAYASNDKVFTDITDLLNYFANAPKQPAQVLNNIFSPRPSFNGTPQMPAQMFAGQNLHINRPPPPFLNAPSPMGRPITARGSTEIPPFATHPPPRMILFSHPMPFMLQTPPPQQIPMNAFPSPQQVPPHHNHRRMLFNPSTPPPPPSHPQSPQSPMFPFLPQMPPSPASPALPPLNEAGTADHPIVNDYLKRFLESPMLDDLIETGNALCHFAAASLIPSELRRALRGMVPESALTIKCFGAKVSGVGYESDNVNLFLEDGTYPKTQQSISALFAKLLEFFSANNEDWVLQNSKLCGLWTHLKVKNCCENVYCQISFDSEPFYANSRLIRYFTGQYPTCQKLCYFVQEFAKLAELNFERNVIVVLAIFYLQMQNALPTVHQLQPLHHQTTSSFPLTFNPLSPSDLKLKPIDATADIRRTARGFFHFYGHKVPLAEYVLCPYDGQVIARADFAPANEWRLSQPRYRVYLEDAQSRQSQQQQQQLERLDVGTPMCVQDLLVLKSNIAAKVGADECKKFVRLCRMADEFYANNGL